MVVPWTPSQSTLVLFKQELWKDQRRLEVTKVDGRDAIAKYYPTQAEARSEVGVLRYLQERVTTAEVPEVLASSDTHALFPYVRGIRVFNLFVELDRLARPLAEIGIGLKASILRRCEERQKELQEALVEWSRGQTVRPYPSGSKTQAIVTVLADCLDLPLNSRRLQRELNVLDEMWRAEGLVPFRDATTKNMVLVQPDLWLGKFRDESHRRAYIERALSDGAADTWNKSRIVDFDFASCLSGTTPEDDPISLRFHERTWTGPPDGAASLVWRREPNATRAALTFVVRYFRFGGRKSAYRLLHPWGHRIRFRYDNDEFYFARLPDIVRRLWPKADDEIPELLRLAGTLSRRLHEAPVGQEWFEGAGLAERRRYYVDMYPE